MTDPQLEADIEAAKQALADAPDWLTATAAWQLLRDLISQRSQSQVRQMERGMRG